MGIDQCLMFHPVGQGLFASGSVGQTEGASYNWVFDCGSSSGKHVLTAALGAFAMQRTAVELLIVSHFDQDHVLGIVPLIDRIKVDTLLFPYVPLWRRLTLAFTQQVALDAKHLDLFINPARYLLKAFRGLERIIFVPPSVRAADPPFSEERRTMPTGDNQMSAVQADTVQDENVRAEFAVDTGLSSSPQIALLRVGGGLRIGSFFEFLPYNDATLAPRVGTQFIRSVAVERDALLDPRTAPKIRVEILRRLRNSYDKMFGGSSKARNVISMFLYVGTVGTPRLVNPVNIPWPAAAIGGRDGVCRLPEIGRRTSTLYTGDGYLDTPRRLKALADYLRDVRMKRLGCVQVMHHGAQSNWHAGVAARLRPWVSVFCSDPGHRRYAHPHASVLRDFLAFGPVQVDKCDGVEIRIRDL